MKKAGKKHLNKEINCFKVTSEQFSPLPCTHSVHDQEQLDILGEKIDLNQMVLVISSINLE